MAALQVARPWFLFTRGAAPTVSIDGSPATDLSVLRTISVTDVHEVRLVRANRGGGRAAVLPNGDVIISDVILVLTKIR